MRPWARWCLNHNLIWLLWSALYAVLPLHVFIGLSCGLAEGFKEWQRERRRLIEAVMEKKHG